MSSAENVKEQSVSNEVEETTPSSQQEEDAVKTKYGGLVPKKPPLISKDHERAFFDSADWALGKQGGVAKPKGPSKLFVPSYSQRSNRRVTGSLHVVHPKVVKMEELRRRPREELMATRSRE